MTKLSRLVLGGWLLSVAVAAPGAEPGGPGDGEIRIDEGARPDRVLRTFQGECGRRLYFIAFAPSAQVRGRTITSVRVGGRKISKAERAKLMAILPADQPIIDASFDRCLDRGVRGRISVADPRHGYELRPFYFTISPDGEVTAAPSGRTEDQR